MSLPVKPRPGNSLTGFFGNGEAASRFSALNLCSKDGGLTFVDVCAARPCGCRLAGAWSAAVLVPVSIDGGGARFLVGISMTLNGWHKFWTALSIGDSSA